MLVVLITQIFVISFSIYLFYTIFTSKNLVAPTTIKLATTILFFGVIWGFLSASFGWVKTSSPILQYYPNFIFNFCVLIEIFLYSLAIGELFFKNAKEKGELNQKIALSELNTLKSQINPHFLFNSLNSIKSLIIGEKPKEAASFLTDLSVLIRRILQNSREQFLPLYEELKFTEEYIKIEKKRFESGFEYHIDAPKDIENQLIPALILQPFVENSIKHGFIDVKANYRIDIKILPFDSYFLIEIIDNGIGRIQAAKHKESGHASLGNSLIEERLKIINELYNWNIQFNIIDLEKGTKVVISIPFFE
jgi:LytS/YehU family sensor histidine kinase